MIDVATEEVLVFAGAAEWLPRSRQGRKVSASTLHRWAEDGVKGVCLEYIVIGRSRCTSQRALQRFFEGVTLARSADRPGPAPDARQPAHGARTESQRKEASAAAGEQLDRMIANPPKRGRPRRAAGVK